MDVSPTKVDLQKQARVRHLRHQLCVREDFPETGVMVKSDGSLNKEYFSVKIQQDDKPWTDDETALLLQGIQKYGVGRTSDIQRDYLSERSVTLLKVKTMRLLGSRDLRRYLGWRGSAELIAKEHEKNKQLGEEQGTWVNGTIDPAQATKRKALEEAKQEESHGRRRKVAS